MSLVAMGTAALTTGAYALLAKDVVDEVVLSHRLEVLPKMILVVIVVSVIGSLSLYTQEYFSSYVGQRVVFDLRNRLYQHVLRLTPSFFSQTSTPRLLSRIINDVEVVNAVFRNAAATLMKEGISIVALVGVLFYRDWFLALISLLVFPVLALLVHYFSNRFRRLSRQRLEQLATVTERLAQSLTNLRVVQAFGREPYESTRFQQETETLFRRLMRMVKMIALQGPTMDLIRGAGIALIFVAGTYRISSGEMSPGTLVSFGTALALLYLPLKRMVHLFNSAGEGLVAISRIFEVLETPPAVRDEAGARTLSPMREEIQFEKVSFAYNREWSLHRLSFTMKAGEIAALVGPSGAGKSTIMSLLLRFYDPFEGRIMIDGLDIRNVTLASLRSQISWVSQENLLFKDTIRANIGYGRLEATDEEIREAARFARAEEFIERFPKGYETVVGEAGLALSGGERQRIAIARAFLKKAPILILDEATSSVDTPTEHLIQEAIRDLVKDRTTLVIAHRPSTISLANKIVLLEHGKLVAVGDHRTLLNQNDLYKALYRSQFLQVAS